MNFIRRRPTLLTREEIMGYIAESALEGDHRKAFQTSFPRVDDPGEGTLRDRTLQACSQASRELQGSPEEEAVARGILAQQVALDQARQILEKKFQRPLTLEELERIRADLPRILAVPAAPEFPTVRGPRIIRDLWGH